MKKIIFALFVFPFLLTSCSSDDDSPSPIPIENSLKLKTQISTPSDGEVVTSNYIYDGNKLIKFTGDHGLHEDYLYTGEFLTDINEYINDELVTTSNLTYDSNNRLINVTKNFVGSSSEGMITTITYNDDDTVTYNINNELEYIYTFLDGNIVSAVDTNKTNTYYYDNKNNPFTNVDHKEVLGFLGYPVTTNNLTTLTQTVNANQPNVIRTVEYSYSSDNYPISATVFSGALGSEEFATIEFIYE
ncbi:hypothetical protein [Bizionia arctica]|uniref:DUF4595 domain-containing protein n=1 Tax=Bizionia arctica TaxID=1495645 RepID=A0A917LT84_9FLAO|nr:hypothetical protein [Bizionia arctica]GGG56501.1 hypothetical protein GCM10010976_29180 [Bizionia arctica]